MVNRGAPCARPRENQGQTLEGATGGGGEKATRGRWEGTSHGATERTGRERSKQTTPLCPVVPDIVPVYGGDVLMYRLPRVVPMHTQPFPSRLCFVFPHHYKAIAAGSRLRETPCGTSILPARVRGTVSPSRSSCISPLSSFTTIRPTTRETMAGGQPRWV